MHVRWAQHAGTPAKRNEREERWSGRLSLRAVASTLLRSFLLLLVCSHSDACFCSHPCFVLCVRASVRFVVAWTLDPLVLGLRSSPRRTTASFTFLFFFPFRMLSFVFVVRCARTRRPCTSSRLDVQQEHEQCGVDDHAVYGTYFRHEEGSFFVRMDLQVFGFSLPSPSISHRLALASFRACQAQLLDPRRVHLPCIPRGGRVRRLPRLPTPSSQLHGHATQPRPRLRRPCDVRFAMTSGMAIVHVHRHVRTCDTVSKVHPRVRKGRSKGNRALSRKKKPERSADERKNRRRDAAGSFFSEARQGGRADPPCHVGMAVEKEGDRTVPCVNLLHSYDMRSSVHDRAPKGQGSARIRVPQRCP